MRLFRHSLHTQSPKKGNKTPDLEGLLGSQRVLCEVKRINISEAESIARRDCSGGMYERDLSSGFFGKLQSSIAQAKDQIVLTTKRPGAAHRLHRDFLR